MVGTFRATAAEWSVEDSLSIVAQRVDFDYKELVQVINGSVRLRHRYEKALAEDYTFMGVAPEELLDLVFGLDSVFAYKGWVIGVDVTLDEFHVPRKLGKLRAMAHEHALIGIDISVVWLVTAESDLSDKGVRTLLSQAIRAKREGVGPICLK